jgi:hypothetical protein
MKIVNSELTAHASEGVIEQVKRELKVNDPTPEEAFAMLVGDDEVEEDEDDEDDEYYDNEDEDE